MDTQFSQRWAYLIGINEYVHVRHLQYCKDDVTKLGEAFRDDLQFQHVIEFREDMPRKPDRDTILHEVGELHGLRKVAPDDLLIFYFCGHGMIDKDDGKDYLLPIGATPYNPRIVPSE